MLYVIGIGLSSIDDVSLRGLNVLKKCQYVFLDTYTSVLTHGIEAVSSVCGKDVKIADREFVEEDSTMINLSRCEDVAFLVVGDPFGATTHTDLILRAVEAGIPFEVIHNASIITGVGCCGLQLYRFGETISIPMWDDFGKPDSYYHKIIENYTRGLHTLCLLDIKVKEKSLENLLKDRDVYEPPFYMTCSQAAYQILEAGSRIRERVSQSMAEGDAVELSSPKYYLDSECLAIGIARVGARDQSIVVANLDTFRRALEDPQHPLTVALGAPLHSLVIPGKLHHMEEQMLSARLLGNLCIRGDRGTCLPFLFPPGSDPYVGDDLKNRVHAMFQRHDELIPQPPKDCIMS